MLPPIIEYWIMQLSGAALIGLACAKLDQSLPVCGLAAIWWVFVARALGKAAGWLP